MTLDELHQLRAAIDEINKLLRLDADISSVDRPGDELKIWIYDPTTGGRTKDYMNKAELSRLIAALSKVRDQL